MRKRMVTFMAVGLVFLTSAEMSWASSAQVTEGRSKLFNNGAPTVSGILAANDTFKTAAQGTPSDREARFFASITRVLASALTKGSWTQLTTVGDLIESFGLARNNTNDLSLGAPYDPPVEANIVSGLNFAVENNDPMAMGKTTLIPQATYPTATKLTDYLSGPFVTMLDASITDLDAIISASSAANPFALTLTAAETGNLTPLEIDLGDVQTFKAMLLTMKAQAQLLHAWNMDNVDLQQLFILDNAGVLQVQRDLLDKYTNFLHLNPGAKATMTEAKATLLSAISTAKTAFDTIAAETGDQTNALFSFATAQDMAETKDDLDQLLAVKASLDNNTAVRLGEENWDWQDGTSSWAGHSLTIRRDLSGAVIGGITDFGWAIDPASTVINADTFTITAKQAGICPGTWTVSGHKTTGPSGEFQLNTITSSGSDCNGSLADQIVNNGTGWVSGYDVHNTIDFNILFGKGGAAPLDIRSYLPTFYADDEAIYDTLNPDITIGGFWPEMTADDFFQPSELETKVATITVDGTASDWPAAAVVPMPSGSLGQSDGTALQDGINLQSLSVARDTNYLYWMLKTTASPAGQAMNVNLTFNKKAALSANDHVMYASLTQDGSGNVTYKLTEFVNGVEEDLGGTTADVSIGGVIEGRIPLSQFAGRALVSISANASQAQTPWGSSYIDSSPAMRLATTSLSGTVSYDAQLPDSKGQTCVLAFNESDPTTGAFLGSAVIDGVGAYTIPGLPIGGQVYLFAADDTDSNGIFQMGIDYRGEAGPIPMQTTGNNQDLSMKWEAAASTTVPMALNADWNLLSSTIGFDVTKVDTTEFTAKSIWKWENGTWSVYGPGEWDKGAAYAKSKNFAFLKHINPGEGFWINSPTATTLQLSGVPTYSDLSFTSGWNLVGRKSQYPTPVGQFIHNKPWAASIWKWENKTWSVALPGEAIPGAYVKSKGFGVLGSIKPGEGVWVNKK